MSYCTGCGAGRTRKDHASDCEKVYAQPAWPAFPQPLTFRSDEKTLSVVLPPGWKAAISMQPPAHNADMKTHTTLGGIVIVEAQA